MSYPDYSAIEDKYIHINGTVEDISFRDSFGQESICITLKEGILCYMKDTSIIPRIGSRISVYGEGYIFETATVPGQFDQREYYYILGIHYGITKAQITQLSDTYSPFKDAMFRLRTNMSNRISALLPAKEASILRAMLLGEKTALDRELKELYQRNGIAHVLAISGLHISLIGMALFRLLRRLRLHINICALTSTALVIGYGFLSGFSVSSLRAIFMFSLSMIAILFKRSYDALTALSIIACAILIPQPLYIRHSGFVFSFGCILTINLLIPALVPKIKSKAGVIYQIRNTCLSSLTIVVGTLPVYYWFYYQLPVYSILLNFLVIPVMSLLVPLGLILIILSYIFVPGAKAISIIIVGILKLFELAAQRADSLPMHYYTPGQPTLLQLILYILILCFIILLSSKSIYRLKWGFVGIAVIALTLRFNPAFELSFLDVGQGDCIFLRSEKAPLQLPGLSDSFSILVDGGSSSKRDIGKYRILPFLKHHGVMELDAVIITHPDSDHTNGIEYLLSSASVEGIKIKELILGDIDSNQKEEEYSKLRQLALEAGIPVSYIKQGDTIDRNGLRLSCLWPVESQHFENTNESSVVLHLKQEYLSALLTGDIEKGAERHLTNTIPSEHIDILKVAHHGSEYSTNTALLDKLNPNEAVISAGQGNSYGHPHQKTLSRLKAAATIVRRTDIEGTITYVVK